jgi:hypothetical protein
MLRFSLPADYLLDTQKIKHLRKGSQDHSFERSVETNSCDQEFDLLALFPKIKPSCRYSWAWVRN